MIIRRNLKWSLILKGTWRELLFYTLTAVIVYICYIFVSKTWFSLPYLPVGMLSTALAIFLGFRNNQVYDRWWEARQLWGALVNYSRSFSRQIINFTDDGQVVDSQKQQIIYNHLAFIYALKAHLRGLPQSEIAPFLSKDELKMVITKDNVPNYILLKQSQTLKALKEEAGISDILFMHIDQNLVQFHNIQGGCERIKNTPLPRQYNYFTSLYVNLHGFLLPFAFVKDMDWVSIPLAVVIAFVFMSLEKISVRLEDPFENSINDIPMSALCRTIEINLKECLGMEELPKKLTPVDGFLL